MNKEFNQWWNRDELTADNLYRKDSPAYWAWEGWQAGARAEREACARVCESQYIADGNPEDDASTQCAAAIRERGEK
jgi:hypothetical protein